MADSGFIYAIRSIGTTYVKIGCTRRNVQRRVKVLQVGHPMPLEIIASIAVPHSLHQIESQIHHGLAQDHISGEWFALEMNATLLAQLVDQAIQCLAMPRSAHSGTPINPRIGERVQRARRRAGWNQEELAEKAGVSFAVISRLETGKQSVSAERLAVIARLLKLSLDDVCRESDDSEERPADAA